MGAKLGNKLGHVLGQIQCKFRLDGSQNPKHDLGQVLGLLLGRQKCLLNCTPALVELRAEDVAVPKVVHERRRGEPHAVVESGVVT